MKRLLLLIILLPQFTYGQQIDFISHEKISLVATFIIQENSNTILDTKGIKKEELISIDTTFGVFVYNQEISDSLFLFIGKTPQMKIGIKQFNWFLSKDGSWNLLLDTNDPSILSLFFIIEDKNKWVWEKELKIWEAPVEIFIGIKEKLSASEKENILLRTKNLSFTRGAFKIPDKIFSALLRIKN